MRRDGRFEPDLSKPGESPLVAPPILKTKESRGTTRVAEYGDAQLISGSKRRRSQVHMPPFHDNWRPDVDSRNKRKGEAVWGAHSL